jgi:hypothetical protein
MRQVAGYPAKAGIEAIEKPLQSRSAKVHCPLRGIFVLLDSRLRGNDGKSREFPEVPVIRLARLTRELCVVDLPSVGAMLP